MDLTKKNILINIKRFKGWFTIRKYFIFSFLLEKLTNFICFFCFQIFVQTIVENKKKICVVYSVSCGNKKINVFKNQIKWLNRELELRFGY